MCQTKQRCQEFNGNGNVSDLAHCFCQEQMNPDQTDVVSILNKLTYLIDNIQLGDTADKI